MWFVFIPGLFYLSWKYFLTNSYKETVISYIPPTLVVYGNVIYNVAHNYLIQSLGVTGIVDTVVPDIKWIRYYHQGSVYKLPIKLQKRGPKSFYEDFDTVFGDQVRGPFGDYHNCHSILRELHDKIRPPVVQPVSQETVGEAYM